MRDEVRETMRKLEEMSTPLLAHRAERFNPFGPDYRNYSRTSLLNLNLRIESGGPLEEDEGWDEEEVV